MCICVCVFNNAQKLPELLGLILSLSREYKNCKIPLKVKFFGRKHIFLFITPSTEYHCVLEAERAKVID